MGEIRGDEERVALLALLDERPALGADRQVKSAWPAIAAEVVLRGSAVTLWDALHPPTLDGLHGGALAAARATLTGWKHADLHLVTVLDHDYPLALREIHQMPPLLFVKGRLKRDDVGVSIVGSRSASARGRSMAAAVAGGLAQRGVAVISGLAAGIDAVAHHAALAAGGRPIGVLGTGITRVFPPQHGSLHQQVAQHGALISQFLPDTAPGKHTFPMRNATISGLGRASVVIEAGERSGSRILARLAVEHGRPVILTDTVAHSTNWGARLQEHPGVYVAGSPSEVLGIVDTVVREHDQRATAVLE